MVCKRCSQCKSQQKQLAELKEACDCQACSSGVCTTCFDVDSVLCCNVTCDQRKHACMFESYTWYNSMSSTAVQCAQPYRTMTHHSYDNCISSLSCSRSYIRKYSTNRDHSASDSDDSWPVLDITTAAQCSNCRRRHSDFKHYHLQGGID